MRAFLLLLAGYILGTAQLVFADWIRERRKHCLDLRFLRAELRRLRGHEKKFEWVDDGASGPKGLPVCPQPVPNYLEAVANTDFRLTDEVADDNAQQSLLDAVNSCQVLQRYADGIEKLTDRVDSGGTDAARKPELRHRAARLAASYDDSLDRFLYGVDDALRDVERRLEEIGWRKQLRRMFSKLTEGSNPEPLTPNDPRLEVWRRKGEPGSGGSPSGDD